MDKQRPHTRDFNHMSKDAISRVGTIRIYAWGDSRLRGQWSRNPATLVVGGSMFVKDAFVYKERRKGDW